MTKFCAAPIAGIRAGGTTYHLLGSDYVVIMMAVCVMQNCDSLTKDHVHSYSEVDVIDIPVSEISPYIMDLGDPVKMPLNSIGKNRYKLLSNILDSCDRIKIAFGSQTQVNIALENDDKRTRTSADTNQ